MKPPAPKLSGATSLEGDLEVFPLQDLIQLLGYSGHRVRVEVFAGERLQGVLWFDAGRLLACQRDTLRGAPAFLALLEVEQGCFRVIQEPELPFQPEEAIPWQGLLLESTLERDERLAASELLDEISAALGPATSEPIDPAELLREESAEATRTTAAAPGDDSKTFGLVDTVAVDAATLDTRVSRFEADYRHAQRLLHRPPTPSKPNGGAIHPLAKAEKFSPGSRSRERDRRP